MGQLGKVFGITAHLIEWIAVHLWLPLPNEGSIELYVLQACKFMIKIIYNTDSHASSARILENGDLGHCIPPYIDVVK